MDLPRSRGRALLGAAAALTLLALPSGAQAATSIAVDGTTVTITGDGADDAVTLTVAGGDLAVNGATDLGGGVTVDANDDLQIVVAPGDGRDTVTASALAADQYGSLVVDGGAGDDLLTGGIDVDALRGGAGDDRIVGGRGNDDLDGGDGNDTLVWNNGDNSDTMDGDGGADTVEVNGAATAGDVFTVVPSGQRVRFDRTNLVPFTLDVSAERMALNGLGGDDSVTAAAGLAALTSLTVDGGTGNDALTGGDGADLISGGDGADALAGGGGDDRLVGDRGADTFAGGAGDDVLVWNNGDGSDVMNGDDGQDRVEVNGALGAGDAFTVAANGARAKFDRTNLVAFTLDIAAEQLEVNGFGGDDTVALAAGAPIATTVDGGSGNDRVDARDGVAQVLRCGSGADVATVDAGDVALDCETVNRSPKAVGQVRTTSVRLRDGRVRVTVLCQSSTSCRGTLALRTTGGSRLGSVRYALAPGRRRTLAVKVSTRRVRGLARRGRLAVRTVLTTSEGTATKRITVRTR